MRMNYNVSFNSLSQGYTRNNISFQAREPEDKKTSKKSKILTYTLTGLAIIASALLLKKGLNKCIKKIKAPKYPNVLKGAVSSTRSEVNKDLKNYMKNNRGKKGIDPSEFDAILTENAAPNGVKERVFTPRPDMPKGRIKYYELNDGTKYVLESHTTSDGNVVTRLYEETSTIADSFGNYKTQRIYLCDDGKFKTNSYLSGDSHLITSEKGKEWLNAV